MAQMEVSYARALDAMSRDLSINIEVSMTVLVFNAEARARYLSSDRLHILLSRLHNLKLLPASYSFTIDHVLVT